MRSIVFLVGVASVGGVVWAERDPADDRVASWSVYGGMPPYTGERPDISEEQLHAYADLLLMDDEQVELLDLAHEAYEERYGVLWLDLAEGVAVLEAAQAVARDGAERQAAWETAQARPDRATAVFLDAIEADRGSERADVVKSYAPVIRPERARRAKLNDANRGQRVEVRSPGGAVIPVRRGELAGDEDGGGDNADALTRLGKRLYEFEQAAADRLRPELTAAQRKAVARM